MKVRKDAKNGRRNFFC